MFEADHVFYSRTAESHVQYSEIEKLYNLCKEDKAMPGGGEAEIQKLISELAEDKLDYSNNTVVDMIIKRVIEYSEDRNVIATLKSTKIADIEGVASRGKAYAEYDDGSHYIEVDRGFLKRLMLLSDYLAVGNIIFENRIDRFNSAYDSYVYIEYQETIFLTLQKIAFDRFIRNEDFTKEYNNFLRCLVMYENIAGSEISDDFIKRSNNIYEAAVAQLIGHEIGHHVYKHTNDEKQILERERLKKEFNLNGEDQFQFLEYQADDFGAGFAIDYIRCQYGSVENQVFIHQLVGIFLPMILTAFENDNITDDHGKHPSIIKRIVRVKWTLRNRSTPETLNDVMMYVHHLMEVLGIYEKAYAGLKSNTDNNKRG